MVVIMKSVYGLALAIALGLGGVILNYFYLWRKAQDFDKVQFIGIRDQVILRSGDAIKEEHIEPVSLPKASVGNLGKYAIPWDLNSSVLNTKVWREVSGPRLLVDDDRKTPPPSDDIKLAPRTQDKQGVVREERAWGIPIDKRQFPVSLVLPGDWVTFIVGRSIDVLPAPSGDEAATTESGDGGTPTEPGATPAEKPKRPPPPVLERIGPFRVVSMGNRLGSTKVMQASRIPPQQEDCMLIAVKYVNDVPDAKAEKLWLRLRADDFRGVGIELHPRPSADQPRTAP
jgi:hypothetical protein